MTLQDILRKYFMKDMDAISTIRLLSGMFDPKNAVTLLTLICTITRHEQGDIDTETFCKVWKVNLTFNLNKGGYPEDYDTLTMDDLKKILTEKQDDKDSSDAKKKDIAPLISYLIYRLKKEESNEN